MSQLLVREHPDSSQIVSSTYDPLTGTLKILFNYQNAEYLYMAVPAQVYDEFTRAKSVGKFLHLYIKGHYKERRIK
jgi:hypothetical protein